MPDLSETEQDSRTFVAPEILTGLRDTRSDVYALGAILYLLCTGNAPKAASQRLRDQPTTRIERLTPRPGKRSEPPALATHQDPTLIAPRQFNQRISPLLEQIILRALALEPEQRFASARDLAEALESMHLKTELPTTPAIATPFPRAKASRLRRLFEWLKR
jgi:serine/threonine protein kinase